jgi:Mut7-C RNAse domain
MLLVLTAVCMQNVRGPNAATTYIPWVHGQETEKRFVCDVMLEGLARQMRLFGLDALSTQQRGKHQRAMAIRYDLKHTQINVMARAVCQACFTGECLKSAPTTSLQGTIAIWMGQAAHCADR